MKSTCQKKYNRDISMQETLIFKQFWSTKEHTHFSHNKKYFTQIKKNWLKMIHKRGDKYRPKHFQIVTMWKAIVRKSISSLFQKAYKIFSKTKGFLQIFGGLSWKENDFGRRCTRFVGSERPLACLRRWSSIGKMNL